MKVTIRKLVPWIGSLVAVSTTVTSSVSLYALGVQCGIGEYYSAALPLALDATGAVAALLWISETEKLRTWGRNIALLMGGASISGNGLVHAITTGFVHVNLGIVLAVGSMIPLSFILVFHLLAMLNARPESDSPVTEATEVQGDPVITQDNSEVVTDLREPLTSTNVKPEPEVLHLVQASATRDEQIAWAVAQLKKGVVLRGSDIDNKFPTGTSTRNGSRYLKAAKKLAEENVA